MRLLLLVLSLALASTASAAGAVRESARPAEAFRYTALALAAPGLSLELSPKQLAALEDFRGEVQALSQRAKDSDPKAFDSFDALVAGVKGALTPRQWQRVSEAMEARRHASRAKTAQAVASALSRARESLALGAAAQEALEADAVEARAPRGRKKGGAKLELFDAHLHFHSPANLLYTPKQIVKLLDEAGVGKALLSSRSNDNTSLLYRAAPGRFVPEIMPYEYDPAAKWDKELKTWFKKPQRAKLVEGLLAEGHPFRGIGEFHLYDGKNADAPVVRRVVQLAARHGLFLHVHTDVEGIRRLFAQDPEAKILWAHAGAHSKRPAPTPQELAEIMKRYPNLRADLSARDDLAVKGRLLPGWEELFLAHSDRFMVGSDPWTMTHWMFFARLVGQTRAWLDKLPTRVAENLAFKTAEAFFELASRTPRPRKVVGV